MRMMKNVQTKAKISTSAADGDEVPSNNSFRCFNIPLGGILGDGAVNGHAQLMRFSEATIRQVRLDCNRAMTRAGFCAQRSEILQLRCMDNRAETEVSYGSQLWYFEGVGVDELDRRHGIFGVVEYSTQYGLNELVEDGVFTSEGQRDRFRSIYEREFQTPDWRQPAHRFLAAGIIAVSLLWLSFLVMRG